MNKKRIYFDYAAATPALPSVIKAMQPYFREKYGNPSSLHSFGQEAIRALDSARETVSKSIGADFREIIFTSSATEANNLALRGIAKAHKTNKSNWSNRSYRIIVSATEHESVLETARDLAAPFQEASLAPSGREKEGAEVVCLPVDREGVVDLEKLKESLNENTLLVSVMYVNNVIGTIQPIAEISNIVRNFRIAKLQNCKIKEHNHSILQSCNLATYPLFHTDAVQAFQYLDCDVNNLGVDLMTFSSHKICGPKGAGALYVRNLNSKSLIPSPLITGGGQELDLRSGTENIPAIVGFAKAVELVTNSRELESKQVGRLRDYFWRELKKIYPKVEINGVPSTNNESVTNKRTRKFKKNSLFVNFSPHILNISLPKFKSQELIIKLDQKGIAVSSGSACSVRTAETPYVLKAMGISAKQKESSIRLSLGRQTNKKEIDFFIKIIKDIIYAQ